MCPNAPLVWVVQRGDEGARACCRGFGQMSAEATWHVSSRGRNFASKRADIEPACGIRCDRRKRMPHMRLLHRDRPSPRHLASLAFCNGAHSKTRTRLHYCPWRDITQSASSFKPYYPAWHLVAVWRGQPPPTSATITRCSAGSLAHRRGCCTRGGPPGMMWLPLRLGCSRATNASMSPPPSRIPALHRYPG